MAIDGLDTLDDGKDREPFVEMDPTGRYGRYKDLLGCGAVKKVYRGFDLEEGIEIAWNLVKLRGFLSDSVMLDRLFGEVRLLKSLKHDSIISLYKKWVSSDGGTLNFITEVCTSGDLRSYRKKHKQVSLKALKKWGRQILLGLDYLHNHEPCVIHRDLNCSNIFINGNDGQVKIGDFGLSAIVDRTHVAHTLLGTPAYMAPELFEENYTELVDIYSFGLCFLEMVTMEIPYDECCGIGPMYKKITSGKPPDSLYRVRDPEVIRFVQRCIGKPRARPSAAELLNDQFFHGLDDDVDGGQVLRAWPFSREHPNPLVDGLNGCILD